MMADNTAKPISPASEFAGLQELATAVLSAASDGNLKQILQEIAHTARRMVKARYAALGIPDGDGGLKHFVISGLNEEAFALIPHPPAGKGLLGAIMNERIAIRLAHIEDDSRSSGFPPHHPEMTSFLGVPIQVGQHLFGQIYLSDKLNGTEFNDDDQRLVETLASYAALALAALELSEQQKRVSLLEERERISMELHDSVIQMLYAVGMELQLLKPELPAPDHLDAPIRHLDASISEIRRHIMNLKSSEAVRPTIRRLILTTLEQLHVPSGISINIDAADIAAPLEPQSLNSLCQICLELLSNAIRHAEATTISIRANWVENQFLLEIADDGKGFDMQHIELGLGLINIQRRVEQLKGSIQFVSQAGSGTQVRVTVPTRE
jgi:signal transduction histidine kinase